MRLFIAGVAAALVCAPAAAADPVAPEAGSSCGELSGAMTQISDGSFLDCPDGTWTQYTGPYPSSDRWFSYGPAVKLHGQGLRNPQILSGAWLATPQDADSVCSASQAAVVSAGEVGPAQKSVGEPGQILAFDVLPVVFSIELSGDCLWQRTG